MANTMRKFCLPLKNLSMKSTSKMAIIAFKKYAVESRPILPVKKICQR